MFGSRRGRTVIGDGLKILGHVTADGLVYGDCPRLRLPIEAWTFGSGLGLIYGG
jgi:hypothetical protein